MTAIFLIQIQCSKTDDSKKLKRRFSSRFPVEMLPRIHRGGPSEAF
jgi:hypothetical protein